MLPGFLRSHFNEPGSKVTNAMWRNRPQIAAGGVSAPPATSLGSAARTVTDGLQGKAASGSAKRINETDRQVQRKRAVQRISPRRRKPDAEWAQPIEIKQAAHWRYQWHEEVLKRWDLSRSQIAVAGVLMHAFNPNLGFAEIGLSKLAARAGCSRAVASRATHRLRALGLLAVLNENVRKPSRSLETCRYSLVYEARGVVRCIEPPSPMGRATPSPMGRADSL
jgi:hypothetical protein